MVRQAPDDLEGGGKVRDSPEAPQSVLQVSGLHEALGGPAQVTQAFVADGFQFGIAPRHLSEHSQCLVEILVFEKRLDRALPQSLQALRGVRDSQRIVECREKLEKRFGLRSVYRGGGFQGLDPTLALGGNLHQNPAFKFGFVLGQNLREFGQSLETVGGGGAVDASDGANHCGQSHPPRLQGSLRRFREKVRIS